MIRLTQLAALLIAAAPAIAHGQHPGPADRPRADSLGAFKARMLAEPIREKAPAPLSDYKLVLTEDINGERYFVKARNDSTLLSFFRAGMDELRIMARGPVFYGDRYALIVQDIPVSTVSTTFWYFERRSDGLEAFKARMLALLVLLEAPAPLSEYKLVWKEHKSGYATSVQAVNDGTGLSDYVGTMGQAIPQVQLTFYGDRYAVITEDIPVSMQDLTLYYFERR